MTLKRHLPGWRSDTPAAFLLDGRRADTMTLVACVGDSITQGQVSANYVEMLRRRWGPAGFHFINAGVNGDLAFNVANRLDAVIACQPDVVTLLVGTNDVNARFNEKWEQRYRKGQGLPCSPTAEWFRENIETTLTRLSTETQARVMVLEIPPLGEDPLSRMNGLVDTYNLELAAAATTHGASYLALNSRLRSLLPTVPSPPPYEGNIAKIMKAAVQHLILRRSWDTISRRNGLTLLTDHIHLNERAAATVAQLISENLVEHHAPTQQLTTDNQN